MPPQRLQHSVAGLLIALAFVASATDSASAASGPSERRHAPLTANLSQIQALKLPAGAPKQFLAASPSNLSREVFGFALASSLGDPTVGYPSWNFSLLSTVAFFGLHINSTGTIVADSGWNVWNSSTFTGLLSKAHASGTKVVLTIVLQDFQPGTPSMCAGLINRATTVMQAVAQVAAKGADGVNVDYEGLNGICQNGQSAQSMMTDFIRELRAALPGGSYLSVDTYASSAIDSLGFFNITGLNAYVDSFFVMAYDLEYSNYRYAPLGCGSFCLGPTAPLTGYYYNDTSTASQYISAVPASKVILGVPYYGRKACVGGPVPNAYPMGSVTADSYLDALGESGATAVRPGSYAAHRDANDPSGQERWDTWYNTSLGCTRELYWDDAVSLGAKYALVNADGLRGVGIWTLNYGGGAPELWSALSAHFASCTVVNMSASPVSPAAIGTTVTFAAQASGCPSPLYHFSVLAPGATSYRVIQDYSPSPTLSWKTTGLVPGTYRFSVWARDAASLGAFGNSTGRWDAYNNNALYTLTPACSAVSVSVSPASPSATGSTITFTAHSAGCPDPLYHFSVLAPGAAGYQIVQAYTTSATFIWKTSALAPGTYRFSVWARDAASPGLYGNDAGRWDAYNNDMLYTLTPACSAVSVSVSPASPSATGSTITFTAHSAGCSNPLYHFSVLAPGAAGYQIVQAYTTSATFIWKTSGLSPGTYRFSVWARDATSPGLFGNSTGRWDAYNNNTLYMLTPVCSAVSVSVSPASPSTVGTTIVVTAHATGCPNPVYHFSIMAPGASGYQVVQVYTTSPTFTWKTSGLFPGTYRFSVWARDASSPGLFSNTAGSWDAFNNSTVYGLS
jgi:spore germination protein YaaH